MGISTDAVIGFGYAVDLDDSNLEVPEDWRNKFYDLEGEENYSNFQFGRFCSDDYPMPFICLKRSYEIAYRGYVTKFESKEFSQEEIQSIKNFADELGLREENEEPYWFLVSYMG